MIKKILGSLIAVCMCSWFSLAAVPEDVAYAIVMANGSKIKISEFSIDLKLQTITYKSNNTGIVATFPLERIKKVIEVDDMTLSIPNETKTVFLNNDFASMSTQDGGIPVIFKVTTKTVNSGDSGGTTKSSSTRKTTSGAGRTASKGSNSSSGSSANSKFGASNSKAQTTRSSSSSSSSGYSNSSSSNNNADPNSFFNALFGGDK